MEKENETPELEVQDAGGHVTRLKTEIDVQIATAKAFPRSIKKFRAESLEMATMSEEIAELCTYALPRDGKLIDGPSVRLAEIMLSAYGNTRSGARVIDNDGRTITAQGVCHDLEKNNVVTMEVKRRITNKYGRTYSEDMQVVTGNAAAAIAFRNAVFKVIPAALIQDIWREVKVYALGGLESLAKRRDTAIAWFKTKGIQPEQIFKLLGVTAAADIDLEGLGYLTGLKSAIKNGEISVSELFEPMEAKKEATVNKTRARGAKAAEAAIGHIKKKQPRKL